MIGNERIHTDAKFMELFKRIGRLELALAEALDRIEEVRAVLGTQPRSNDGMNNRKTLSLRSGTR